MATALFGCKHDEEKVVTPDEGNTGQLEYGLGGVGNENFNEVPVNTKFGYASADNLPASVDLTAYMPPIGNQGQYGTCASWSTGYYAKTTVEGIAKGYTATQLSNVAYQISPRDLFTAIPENNQTQKGADCNGSGFSDNLNVLQERGAAPLSVVPYTNMGNCSKASASPSWDSIRSAKSK